MFIPLSAAATLRELPRTCDIHDAALVDAVRTASVVAYELLATAREPGTRQHIMARVYGIASVFRTLADDALLAQLNAAESIGFALYRLGGAPIQGGAL